MVCDGPQRHKKNTYFEKSCCVINSKANQTAVTKTGGGEK